MSLEVASVVMKGLRPGAVVGRSRRPLEYLDETACRYRLVEKITCPEVHCRDSLLRAAKPCEDDEWDPPTTASSPSQNLETRNVGEPQVCNDDFDGLPGEQLEAF
jgi:hypothetical protein